MFGSAGYYMSTRTVDIGLRIMKSKSVNLLFLKENIRMRTLGLGWKDFDVS